MSFRDWLGIGVLAVHGLIGAGASMPLHVMVWWGASVGVAAQVGVRWWKGRPARWWAVWCSGAFVGGTAGIMPYATVTDNVLVVAYTESAILAGLMTLGGWLILDPVLRPRTAI